MVVVFPKNGLVVLWLPDEPSSGAHSWGCLTREKGLLDIHACILLVDLLSYKMCDFWGKG